MKTKKILSLVLAVLLLFGTMSVTAFAGDDDCATCGGDGLVGDNNDETCAVCGGTGKLAYLDLDETSDNKGVYPNNKTIDQNYTFTESGITYTDVTKVKLDWTISDIAATYKSHKTWNPDTMAWVEEAKEDIAVTNEGATFNITNYSSEGIIANVEFKVEESLKDTFDKATFTNNNCAVKTPVTRDNNTYQDSGFTALKKTITASLTFNKDEFADLTATSSATNYGTYTVTIKGPQYLTFTANEAGSSVTPNFKSGTWQYSTDNGANWTDGTNYEADINGDYVSGTKTTITLQNVDDRVMLRGIDCTTWLDLQNFEHSYHFSMIGSVSASGDVTSLTNGIGGNEVLTASCYHSMFLGCSALTTAPNVPSETLADSCYYWMFSQTSIATAPVLPATTLANSCYYGMFQGCKSLVTAPVLPATTLAEYCYCYMFLESGLVTTPALPATTLAKGCYQNMFSRCEALTSACELKATELFYESYTAMFSKSDSLNITTVKPASGTEGTDWGVIFSGAKALTGTSAENAVLQMFEECTLGDGVSITPTIGENITYYWYK